MTAPAPVLDADTIEALQPPCQYKTCNSITGAVTPCHHPAVWVTRFHCDNCAVSVTGLYCGPHHVSFHRKSRARCARCKTFGRLVVDSTEPIGVAA